MRASGRRNLATFFVLFAVVAGMGGLAYASVPLYRLFCQVTGYGGTTQVAEGALAPDAVLDRVIKTVKLTAVQHPVLLPVRLSVKPVRDERLGFAVRPPISWYVRSTPMGISMGQTDYLTGGWPSPLVTVAVAEVAEGAKSKACLKKAIQPYLAAAREGGPSVDILSHEVTKMGGNPAHQVMIRLTPKGSPATRPGKEPPAPDARQAPGKAAQLRILRVICVAADKDRPFRSYAMIMVCRTAEMKAVRAAMDTIAGGFEVLSSTAPDTRPADKKAAKKDAKKAAK